MNYVGTVRRKTKCENCGKELEPGRMVVFEHDGPDAPVHCCTGPGPLADIGAALYESGRYHEAAIAFDEAVMRTIGHNRAARYKTMYKRAREKADEARGPASMTIRGTLVHRVGNPLYLKGETWDTYVPDCDDDPRIWERAQGSGRTIQTGGDE